MQPVHFQLTRGPHRDGGVGSLSFRFANENFDKFSRTLPVGCGGGSVLL